MEESTQEQPDRKQESIHKPKELGLPNRELEGTAKSTRESTEKDSDSDLYFWIVTVFFFVATCREVMCEREDSKDDAVAHRRV